MAVYRNVYINFWQDSKVLDEMTIEERYFMLYLLTNPHSNQIGCFEISKRQIKNETDFETRRITELLDKFENELGIIIYSNDTKELFIKNWYKYNWSKSPTVINCIEKEFINIKNDKLKEIIYKMLTEKYGIDRLSIQYIDGIYSLCIKKEKEKEKEKEKKEEEEKVANATTSTTIFNFSSILKYGFKKNVSEEYCKKFFDYYSNKKRKWINVEEWQKKFDEWLEQDKTEEKETKITKIDEGVFKI